MQCWAVLSLHVGNHPGVVSLVASFSRLALKSGCSSTYLFQQDHEQVSGSRGYGEGPPAGSWRIGIMV